MSLSEQQLMDCSWTFNNYGCDGGKVDRAFDYVSKNGLCAEKNYCYLSYVRTHAQIHQSLSLSRNVCGEHIVT